MRRSRYAERTCNGENPMLLLSVAVVVGLVAVVILPRTRALSGMSEAPLGWMSEQWLAEHRAGHPR